MIKLGVNALGPSLDERCLCMKAVNDLLRYYVEKSRLDVRNNAQMVVVFFFFSIKGSTPFSLPQPHHRRFALSAH